MWHNREETGEWLNIKWSEFDRYDVELDHVDVEKKHDFDFAREEDARAEIERMNHGRKREMAPQMTVQQQNKLCKEIAEHAKQIEIMIRATGDEKLRDQWDCYRMKVDLFLWCCKNKKDNIEDGKQCKKARLGQGKKDDKNDAMNN